MSDDATRAWAAAHLSELWRASRRTREASAQLDGALTAGQSSSPDTRVGFSLKYEVGDGLLDELTDLVVAAQDGGPISDPVSEVGRVAWDAHNLISNDLRAITSASYRASRDVERVRFALRDLADAIDEVLLDLLRDRAQRP